MEQFWDQDYHNIDLINTVCMIDESKRLDQIFIQALMREDLLDTYEIDQEIEKMILEDIEYWEQVYEEYQDYWMPDPYEMYDDYI